MSSSWTCALANFRVSSSVAHSIALKKLDVRSRGALVRLAAERQWLDD
jgi:hypothetical protein